MNPRELRARAADAISSALERGSRFTCVDYDEDRDADRLTFVLDHDLRVTVVVVDARPSVSPDATACPWCGSTELQTSEQAGCHPRRGCLSCDRWLDPVRVR